MIHVIANYDKRLVKVVNLTSAPLVIGYGEKNPKVLLFPNYYWLWNPLSNGPYRVRLKRE